MRPQVTSVAVTLSDGRTITLDGTQFEGIFWVDRTVNQMLAPFYNTFAMQLTPGDLSEAPDAIPVLGGQTSVAISPALVGQLWNAPNASGNLPCLMLKTGKCIPAPRY